MKKLLSLFLALLMVFTLFPVSALADGDAVGEPSAEEVTQTAEEPRSGSEEAPAEKPGEIPEGKAEEKPEDKTEETLPSEETPPLEDTPEPEDQTKYPWEDMTDEEFAAYIYAEENREYLISLMTGADEAAYISFADRVERIEDEELYVQLSGYLYGLLGTDVTELASTYSVVMTADSFIQYLKTALGRKTVYNKTYPYNVGYYDGSTISWDCWNLGKSIIWSNGAVVSNYTIGNYVGNGITRDQSCGLGDWTGSGILQACDSYSSDFSSLVPGEWLFMGAASSIYHVGYYIGDGKVIECTSGSFKRVIESNIDSNGYSSTTLNTWSYHAKVPWLDYKGSGYLSKCEYYPSYLTVKMTKDYRVWSLPCSNETDSASSVIKTITSGTSLTVTALYKNDVTTSDHYWYRVRLSDGTVGYVYAQFCKVTNYGDTAIKNGISASGKDVPASLPVSNSYPVDWTITSTNADISAISGTIHTWGTTMSYGRTEQVRSKNLNNSELDSAMHFDWIASPGSYDFYIKVQVENYYCADNSNTLQSKTIEKTVLNGPIQFTDGDSGHTTHSYTSQVVAPTCTEQGYTLYTCSVCSASYKDNYTDAKGHSWNSGTVTTAATCEKSGVKTYTCTACQTKKTETIAATGHKLVYGSWEGSCTERPHRLVSCANCDYQYTEYNMEGNWSDWSTTKPTGVADEYIETQQRYRTRNKLTTTGTSNTMSGWTLSGSEKVWSDYGAWSDWSTDAVSASDSTQVETTTLYGYYYYYCSNCGAHMHGYGTCYTWAGGCGATTYSSGWRQEYFPYSWSSSTSDWHGTGKYVATINGENWFKWDDHTATGYRYRTRTQQTVYSFYKWDDWSGWVSGSDAPAATDTMQVEKQTLYRYDLYATGTHTWDSGVVTTPAQPGVEGVRTYTCTVCKQTRTEVIPALPITYTVSYDANGGSGAPASQTKTKDVTLTLSSTKPTRTGYTFLGWATSKTATSAQYQPGGSYTTDAAVTLYAVWKIITYTVSYDANGGSGAPAAQTKTHGTALTLSSTKPTRTGYTFLGWATSKTATSAQYQPGGSYTTDAAVTLYAVWKEDAPTYATTLTVSSATASQGKEVALDVAIKGNPGVALLNFQISYDKNRLQLIGYKDAAFTEWGVGVGESEKAIWANENGSTANGTILTLTFKVLDSAEEGLATVTLTGLVAGDSDENKVNISVIAGGITVSNRLPGDVNDDGVVDAFDLLRLKKYFAGFSVTINTSNADVNGDGVTDAFDYLRLKKYFAGMNVELK